MRSASELVQPVFKTAFACPHCGTFTTHKWAQAFGDDFANGALPAVLDPVRVAELKSRSVDQVEAEVHQRLVGTRSGTP